MKVIAFDTYGGPDVLHLVEAPIPEVGSHQIRIQVFAAAINPHDVMVRAGDQEANFSSNARAPRRPGMDAAGVVDSIGADADTDLVEGDAVIAIVDPFSASGGAYAEYITVEVDQVVRSPPGATASEAATLPLNGLTAYGALQALSLHSGQTVWVTGAAGGVGGYAVQLAKTLGLNVIADAALTRSTQSGSWALTSSLPAISHNRHDLYSTSTRQESTALWIRHCFSSGRFLRSTVRVRLRYCVNLASPEQPTSMSREPMSSSPTQ